MNKSNNTILSYSLIVALLIVGAIVINPIYEDEDKSSSCTYQENNFCKDSYGEYQDYCEGDKRAIKFYCDVERCDSKVVECSENEICRDGQCLHEEIQEMRELNHNICHEGRCIPISEEGIDECVSSTDCMHKECIDKKCEVVYAPGENKCKTAADCECVCDSGLCCDGCYYRDTDFICDPIFERDFGCPWGTECGNNVAVRYKTRYCSGYSVLCNGRISEWGKWNVYDECNELQICIDGTARCKYNQICY